MAKTYRERILSVLKVGERNSLSDITRKVGSRYKVDVSTLSGSFSTLLQNMVDKKEVYVDGRMKGPRGGKMYYKKG